jgi:hypothetical protein
MDIDFLVPGSLWMIIEPLDGVSDSRHRQGRGSTFHTADSLPMQIGQTKSSILQNVRLLEQQAVTLEKNCQAAKFVLLLALSHEAIWSLSTNWTSIPPETRAGGRIVSRPGLFQLGGLDTSGSDRNAIR